jgi:hypothetical protein
MKEEFSSRVSCVSAKGLMRNRTEENEKKGELKSIFVWALVRKCSSARPLQLSFFHFSRCGFSLTPLPRVEEHFRMGASQEMLFMSPSSTLLLSFFSVRFLINPFAREGGYA